MDIGREIEIARAQLNREVDTVLMQLRQRLEAQAGPAPAPASGEVDFESIYPLVAGPALFKGKKPTGVIFGECNRVDTGTWKGVFTTILLHCNADPERHVKLMNLRGRIFGRERVLLASAPAGMTKPAKIADNLYVETHYDTQTLLKILMTRILDAVHYDYSGISVAIRNGS